MKNYYEILEVNPKASKEVIEKAYKVLIKKYHPDIYDGEKRSYAEEKSKDINEAYKILSDQFLKEQYDKELQKEADNEQMNKYYKNNQRSQNSKNKTYKNTNKDKVSEKIDYQDENTNEIGSFKSLIYLVKTLFRNKPNMERVKDLKREDMIAAGITLAIVIVLGIILWFIPLTNGFIRSLIPFI